MRFKNIFLLTLAVIAATASKTQAKKIKYAGPEKIALQDSISLRNLRQNVFSVPEFFLFDIDWGYINAGQATLELVHGEKPNQWEIRTHAWCNAFFQTFYPVYDTIFSIIDSAGIYPIRFEKHLHEGNYEAHIKSWFDQERHRAWLQDTICDIAPFTHDILSAFYYIRAQELSPGKFFEMDAVSGKKKYKLKVVCHQKQTIKVPAGEFKTIVVEPKVVGVGLFKSKGKLTIWLTDDEFHIPVKMKSKIPVGSISANLVKAVSKSTIQSKK